MVLRELGYFSTVEWFSMLIASVALQMIVNNRHTNRRLLTFLVYKFIKNWRICRCVCCSVVSMGKCCSKVRPCKLEVASWYVEYSPSVPLAALWFLLLLSLPMVISILENTCPKWSRLNVYVLLWMKFAEVLSFWLIKQGNNIWNRMIENFYRERNYNVELRITIANRSF